MDALIQLFHGISPDDLSNDIQLPIQRIRPRYSVFILRINY